MLYKSYGSYEDNSFEIIELTGESEDETQVFETIIQPGTSSISIVCDRPGVIADVAINGESIKAVSANNEGEEGGIFIVNVADGQLQDDASMTVRIAKGRRSPFKISILKIWDHLSNYGGHISCRVCKKLIKHLISLILAGFGIPYYDFSHEVTDAVSDALQGFGDNIYQQMPDELQQFFASLNKDFIQQIKDALNNVLERIRQFLDPLNRIVQAICRELGFC